MSSTIVSKKNAFSRRISTPAVRSPVLLAMPSVSVKYKHDVVVATTVKLLRTCRNKQDLLKASLRCNDMFLLQLFQKPAIGKCPRNLSNIALCD